MLEQGRIILNPAGIAELLKSMNFSYQKARFESDHLDEEKRQEWLKNTWPEILELSRKKNALIPWDDFAAIPYLLGLRFKIRAVR